MKFRFVDKILSWTPHQQIRGVKTVSFEEYSLKDAWGDEPHLPESLLLESILQLGNWLILLSSDFQQMAMVVKLAEVQFHNRLRPGQRLTIEVNLVRRREDGLLLTGQGWVDDKPIITGRECLAVAVPAQDYVAADDLRTLFSEIYQPVT